MDFSRFDEFYFTIAKETGGIEGLLNSLFNFLIRRTDFFYESDPGDKMGFPPGYSQQMVMNIFKQYQTEHYKKFPKKNPEDFKKKAEIYKQQMEAEKLKQQQQEIEEKRKQYQQQQQKEQQENENNQQQQNVEEKQKIVQQLQHQEKIQNNQQQTEQAKEQITQKQEQKIEIQEEAKINKKQEQQQKQEINSVQPKQNLKIVDEKFVNISTYNGGVTEKYAWSQNVQEITVQVNVPQGVYKKNVIVDIKTNHLKIQLKNEQNPLVDGELYDKIRVDESLWSIEDNNKIILTLEKANENIWKTVIKGDQEIDATKVDNSKKLEEFDTETQGALRKIMYEQQRKQMGLPTTEEEKQQELLKKAWNAEGSPFKGTPFNPEQINFAQNNQNFNM